MENVRGMLLFLGVVCVSILTQADAGATDAQTTRTSSASSAQSLDQSTNPNAPDPRKVIEEHLALGKILLQRGQYPAAQAEFRAILQLDATHHEALQLMTKAQQGLEAQQAIMARTNEHLRRLAQDLSVKVAREKEKERTKKETQAREQMARAREQQVKFLYRKGVELYRHGQYQEAIEALQHMVPLDPTHPLVRDAQRLMTQAETKLAEARARASTRLSATPGPANLTELEQQLTAKRIEVETVLKYAKLAMKDRHYDMAIELLQRVLAQDPQHRQAQQLLEQAQMTKLKEEEDHLKSRVVQDEQKMVNDVVKAQVLPEPTQVQLSAPHVVPLAERVMAEKLRQPISLDFTDVALSDVLDFIADSANISIIPSPQIDLKSRHVSLKVSQLPLELALKYLTKNQSLAYHVEPDAILIASPEEFSKAPMQTRVFFLRNGLGPFALETAAVTSNPVLAMEPLKDLIKQTIPQPDESKLVIDERSGALIVTNTDENLQLVAQLLSQLDVTPVQVLIEARFIELTMTDLEQMGVEAVLNGDYPLSKHKDPGGGIGPGNIIAKGGGFKFPNLARQDEGSNITLEGVLTSLQFESVLHLLQESKKSKTLSAPRVTALNNQTAQIRVVDEFNYPTRYEVQLVQFDINGDGDFDDAGETQYVNVPVDFQKRNIGILLNVTPSVGKDMKTITLVLAPEVSSAGAFRDLGGGVSVPDFTSSQLTTSVVIEDSQTVVLGGLMKDDTSSQTTKIPVLGDLPVVGGLFRQKEESSKRKNLLIFITAHILAPRGPTT